MSSPVITVVTAARNAAQYLGETIESVQSQDFQDWEYIIVDDDSGDDTCEVVEAKARSDGRIRLLRRNSCGGPYIAANDALRVSRGRYIFRIDGDDICPKMRFTSQLRFMQEHPQYRASVGFWQAFGRGRKEGGKIESIPESPRVFKWYLLLRSASIHSTACFERAALDEVGGYCALPLSQDYRMWCDLTRRNWLGILPQVLSYVRFHSQRATHRDSDVQRRLALAVTRDHWSALTGERCSDEELAALGAAGYSASCDISAALSMLRRWETHWRSDPLLTNSERQALNRLMHMRLWKLLRANVRNRPASVFVRAIMAAVISPSSLAELPCALFTA